LGAFPDGEIAFDILNSFKPDICVIHEQIIIFDLPLYIVLEVFNQEHRHVL